MGVLFNQQFSDWEFEGTTGVVASVGSPGPAIVSLGAGQIQLPMRNTATDERITLDVGVIEVEAGAGLSPLPVDLNIGPNGVPTGGSRISLGRETSEQLTASSFHANIVRGWDLESGLIGIHQLILVCFYTVGTAIVSSVIPTFFDDIMAARCGGVVSSFGGSAEAAVTHGHFVGRVLAVHGARYVYRPPLVCRPPNYP